MRPAALRPAALTVCELRNSQSTGPMLAWPVREALQLQKLGADAGRAGAYAATVAGHSTPAVADVGGASLRVVLESSAELPKTKKQLKKERQRARKRALRAQAAAAASQQTSPAAQNAGTQAAGAVFEPPPPQHVRRKRSSSQ